MINHLNAASGVPLYRQLSDAIRESIDSGEFEVDSQIPTEPILSKMYNVSRVTVRKAIDELVEDRVLIRRQGKGTFVASKYLIKNIYPFVSFNDACQAVGRIPTTKVLSYSLETPTKRQAEFFSIQHSSKIICIKRLRLADDIPVVLETNLFPQSFDFLARESLESVNLVLNKYGINPAHADAVLNICFATEEESVLLQVEPDTPLLYSYSEVRDHDYQPFEISKQIVRTDHYQFLVKY